MITRSLKCFTYHILTLNYGRANRTEIIEKCNGVINRTTLQLIICLTFKKLSNSVQLQTKGELKATSFGSNNNKKQ